MLTARVVAILLKARYLIAMGLSSIYLTIGALGQVNIYDEGFAVFGAARVLEGEIPYIDFWTIYAPGQFYVLAGIFRLFGTSLIVERVYDVLVRLALAIAVFLIVRKLSSSWTASISALAIVIWLGAMGFHGYAMFPALLLSLVGVLCAFEFLAERQRAWLLISGLAVGSAAVFRHDIGMYALVSVGAVVGVAVAVDERDAARTQLEVAKRALAKPAWMLLGALTILAPVSIFFARTVTFGELWADLIIFPAETLHDVRSLPYPPLVPNPLNVTSEDMTITGYASYMLRNWVGFYFPPLLFIATAFGITMRFRSGLEPEERLEEWRLVLVTLLGVMLFTQSLSRADDIHFMPASIAAIILLARETYVFLQNARVPLRLTALGIVLIVCFLSYILIPGKTWLENAKTDLGPSNGQFVCSNLAERSAFLNIDTDQARAICYVQDHVVLGGRIFVGNERHDRIFVNDISFYFLANRNSATKYPELYPGVATTSSVQASIIEDIKRHGLEYVVLVSGLQGAEEPNRSSVSSGVRLLDDYIASNYKRVEQFGRYTILRKS